MMAVAHTILEIIYYLRFFLELGHAYRHGLFSTTELQRRRAVVEDVIGVEDLESLTRSLFDDERDAAAILKSILDAQSPRLSEMSHRMEGSPSPGYNYKRIQRFLKRTDPTLPLMRLYDEDAPFVIGDATEIARPQAKKTPYVGILKDGKTRGFLVLTFGYPYRGRVIPFAFVTYSSQTIAEEATSRNREPRRGLSQIKDLLGETPVILDREFSYEALFTAFRQEGVSFVIRLNTGNRAEITDKKGAEGRPLDLPLVPGKRVYVKGVYYKRTEKVNLAGEWGEGFKEPLWVITDLEPEKALRLYRSRMKIEESFKDLKGLLHLDRVMSKTRENMEKGVALVLLAYALGLLIGEGFRDALYPEEPLDTPPTPPPSPDATSSPNSTSGNPVAKKSSRTKGSSSANVRRQRRTRRQMVSGLFILLRQRIRLAPETIRAVLERVVLRFLRMLKLPHVPTQG